MKEYKIKINDNDYKVKISQIEDNLATVTVNGVEYKAQVEGVAPKPKKPKAVHRPSAVAPTDYHPSTARTSAPMPEAEKGKGISIKSPLPGVILDILVRKGDRIAVGQKLIVLEAMKMENSIDSDVEGVVKSIAKNKGDSVMEGDVLLTLE